MGIYKLLANQPVVECLHFSRGSLIPLATLAGKCPWPSSMYGGAAPEPVPLRGTTGEGWVIRHRQSAGHWDGAVRCLRRSIFTEPLVF